MRNKVLLSISLGIGLAIGSGAALAQNQPVTDTLTKPLGAGDDSSNKSGDKSKSTPSTSSKGTATDGGNALSFGSLDVNTDRKLSRDEVKSNTSLTADFEKLDANRDGSLSNGEFAKFESGSSDKDSDSKAEKNAKEGKSEIKENSRDAERKFDDATDTK